MSDYTVTNCRQEGMGTSDWKIVADLCKDGKKVAEVSVRVRRSFANKGAVFLGSPIAHNWIKGEKNEFEDYVYYLPLSLIAGKPYPMTQASWLNRAMAHYTYETRFVRIRRDKVNKVNYRDYRDYKEYVRVMVCDHSTGEIRQLTNDEGQTREQFLASCWYQRNKLRKMSDGPITIEVSAVSYTDCIWYTELDCDQATRSGLKTAIIRATNKLQEDPYV